MFSIKTMYNIWHFFQADFYFLYTDPHADPGLGFALQRMRIHITDITPLKHMAFSELTFCSLLGMTLAVS